MRWINKNIIAIARIFVIVSILWVLFGPWLLTQHYYSFFSFDGSKGNTGIIGDTIGGITAPVVGLSSVVLLFLALIKQTESNEISVHEANFRIIYEEIAEVRTACEIYTTKFSKEKGIKAIQEFAAFMDTRNKMGFGEMDYQELAIFEVLLNRVHKVFYLLDNLKTSIEYKDILSKDLKNTVSVYFNSASAIINTRWNVSKDDLGHMTRGKMFVVQETMKAITKRVSKY